MATGAATETGLEALRDLLQSHPHMLYGEVEAFSHFLPGIHVHPATPSAARAAELAAILDPETHTARPTYARAPDAALPGGKSLK